MITEIISFMKNNAGATAGGGGLIGLLAVRFLPQILADLRERRLAARTAQLQDKQEVTQREHELMSKIDRKDAMLEKLTGNHIQHLEIQLTASREFYSEAVKLLASLNSSQENLARELQELRRDAADIKNDTSFIKGGLS